MKTKSFLFALFGLVSVAFIACDQKNTPEEPVDPQDTTVVPVDTTDVPVDTTDVPVSRRNTSLRSLPARTAVTARMV